ncbi:uracil-DNA glycosylase family protein [Accumulibacter sp.]|uniref:uracil-DNA glycosylase family protein n=1 Tax=Accumulibacter sp. TaxID=2053492 RepID=UPI002C5E9529|nr:uracil-DNA glycosylase family protein [Accumulibacter sp.]HMW64160.1 single-stranded DNA-binding protein [Accumulibacter sp.]HMW80541.1 single-stranded DNA-binding protein [Accumulibacter sp.]HNC27503.1 single-stranded DNA-binding protein [Accumulibacter sp.]HND39541.1 single-stranded DNA-binding protein [Accumulibacter sp.]HNL98161.1 single-stranded DNA-binding protein [Accumulibacter sp.]
MERSGAIAESLSAAARDLSARLAQLSFAPPVSHVYDPLSYAWQAHETYLRRYAASRKRVIFLGMNPGPFGMVQTGVPFGEVAAVRDWLGIETGVGKPLAENPRRPVEGFACQRSEVSGRRLWGLFRERFGSPEAFFAEHFVANYCPLAFFDGGRNLTPDKLPAREAQPLHAACDAHLQVLAAILQPAWVIGVGAFAEARARAALSATGVRVGRVLHPSPASPLANQGWASAAAGQLAALGVWGSSGCPAG